MGWVGYEAYSCDPATKAGRMESIVEAKNIKSFLEGLE